VSKNKVSEGQNTKALSQNWEEPGQYWHSNGNKPQKITVAVGLSPWNVKSSPYRTTQLLKQLQNKMWAVQQFYPPDGEATSRYCRRFYE